MANDTAQDTNSFVLRGIWKCHRFADLKSLVIDTYRGWISDRAPRLGAALAFYTLLSLAPITVVVLAIASRVFGEKAAEGRLIWEIQGLVGQQGGAAIQALIGGARMHGSGVMATLLGLGTLFFGATAVVTELRDALNTIWKAPVTPAETHWHSIYAFLRDRVFSFAMVIGIGFLLVVSLVVNAVLSAAGRFFSDQLPTPEWILQILNSLLSFVVIAILFAVLFKVMPAVTIEWKDVVVGAALTSLLFSLGKLLIGLYLGKTTLASGYGAAGSLVIVIVWVYYSAQIFFLGAEFTYVYAQQYGSFLRRRLELNPPPAEHEEILV